MTDPRTEGSVGLDDVVWARKGLCFAEHKRFWCVMALGSGGSFDTGIGIASDERFWARQGVREMDRFGASIVGLISMGQNM